MRPSGRVHPGGVTGFRGVVTTGIYCRPGCPARPDAENVVAFGSQAAAEAAGFRACLRCRPYRVEADLGAVGPDLVCRAVHRIVDGALDGGRTEGELARDLHVSARHLRRLFVEHVGATPDGLARSRRAHFARRLLDDTDLSLTEVARAAGFGSLRQFNRACSDTFGLPPSQLRARRRATDRLVADGGLRLRLPFRGPLDGHAALGFLRDRAIPGVEVVDGDTYRRTVLIDGDPGVLELTVGAEDHVLLTAHLPHWEGLTHVVQRARRVLALDADLEGWTAALADDPTIGPLLRARPGLRPPGTWDPFEVAVRAVVGQQVSVRRATTLLGHLAARAGDDVPGLAPMGLARTFPDAAQVAEADLDGLGLTTARAATVRRLAAAVAGGEVLLDRGRTLEELTDRMAALHGIGPWTAQYIALRLGELDAWPSGDRALERAVPPEAGPDGKAWRPFRAAAAVHLWNA